MAVLAFNRGLSHDYEVLEKFKSGMVLKGYDVKAIREGKADFEGSFVKVINGRPFILNLKIGRYSKKAEPLDESGGKSIELLMKGREVERMAGKVSQKGLTLAPLQLISEHGLIKLEFALVRGKKKFEKKEELKKREQERELTHYTFGDDGI